MSPQRAIKNASLLPVEFREKLGRLSIKNGPRLSRGLSLKYAADYRMDPTFELGLLGQIALLVWQADVKGAANHRFR
jgi:hypothetical protein